MDNIIAEAKIEKYFSLTSKALAEIRQNIAKKSKREAKEIIDMVSNYLSDAEYFRGKKDFVNAFASINYAHGWIDCGVRLGIFNVTDDKLFTIK
ncbi:MAG: DUF357 domain-containing protein [Candidatus Pacearchaeota archaeon]|nr:DUF357 domain-containing protein [Candidatus Pacearchaeota archaeon]